MSHPEPTCGKAHTDRQSGFTLLEILVALAILAIALTAIIKAASSQSLNTIHLREKTFAHWLAMNQMTELQLTAQWPAKGKQEGDEELGPYTWHWVRTITDTPDERVRQVEIAIYHDKADEHSVTRLISFLAQPM
jgi:general secretion pathway protein I